MLYTTPIFSTNNVGEIYVDKAHRFDKLKAVSIEPARLQSIDPGDTAVATLRACNFEILVDANFSGECTTL